jgi:hypothetical protein
MAEYPETHPIDYRRGYDLLRLYGAFAGDNGHTIEGDCQRILSDLFFVLLSESPESDCILIAEKALARTMEDFDD